MKFRNMFKIRKPGNGGAFEASVARAKAASKAKKLPSKDNSQNSGGKKPA